MKPLRWVTDRAAVNITLASDSDALLGESSPYDWAALEGFRSPDKQNADYAQGRTTPGDIITNAQGFQSPHTVTDPEGDMTGTPDSNAIDVARVDEQGHYVYDYATHPAWPWLWAALKEHPRLHSGHEFPTPDNDHIETVNWRFIRQRLIAAGLFH